MLATAMPLLTDRPESASGLLPPGAAFAAVGAAGLPAEIGALWTDLGGGTAAWLAEEHLAVPAERWILVVGEAQRSQFDLLNERLAAGASLPPGLACLAIDGRRFHGQRGRPWQAYRGNLHLCVHLPLDLPAEASQAALAALPAVATAASVEAVSQGLVAPRLKWVNDLLVEGRKLGGVLVATQLQGARLRHAMVGIGLNVVRAPELPPTPRALPAVALSELDPLGFPAQDTEAWTRLVPAVLQGLEQGRRRLQAGEGASIVADYRRRAAFIGRQVIIWPESEAGEQAIAQGRVLRLHDDLSLEIEGHPRPIRHGRLALQD